MSFVSVNEFNQFSYEDCQVKKIDALQNGLCFTLEALIIKARNSQNSNYTDSYSDETTLTVTDMNITSMIKEGYKKYDANDKLLEEVEDIEVAGDIYKEFFIKNESVFLVEFSAEKQADGIYEGLMEFEMPAEVGDVPDTYEMKFSFATAKFCWERYMNRVEQ